VDQVPEIHLCQAAGEGKKMAKATIFCNDLLKLIFNATAIANIADNAASSPVTNLYLSLHTADPGIGGAQTTNETAYTNYARVAVTRNSGGWTVTSNSAANTALAQFPQCGLTPGAAITHVAIGTALSGAGKVLYAGALTASLAVANLIQPQFSAAALTATET
jgi:hypothetical protein